MFITDLDIETATNQEKYKIMKLIITGKSTHIPHIDYRQAALLRGCKEEDIKRYLEL